jgi:hypothetical protein
MALVVVTIKGRPPREWVYLVEMSEAKINRKDRLGRGWKPDGLWCGIVEM